MEERNLRRRHRQRQHRGLGRRRMHGHAEERADEQTHHCGGAPPGQNRQLPDIIGEGDAIAYEEKTIDASADTLRDADIVISTIPGHAADAVAEAIGNDDSFRPRGILLDVVYDPRPSALIRAWRAKGGLAIGGEEMLLWQAILQVILMTGADTADSSLTDVLEPAMRHALEEAL